MSRKTPAKLVSQKSDSSPLGETWRITSSVVYEYPCEYAIHATTSGKLVAELKDAKLAWHIVRLHNKSIKEKNK